jgi:hypothetical protein
MLRDLLTQKCSLILDSPEHVDSENIKLKIGYGSSLFQLFSKRDLLKIVQNCPKFEFFDFFAKSYF